MALEKIIRTNSSNSWLRNMACGLASLTLISCSEQIKLFKAAEPESSPVIERCLDQDADGADSESGCGTVVDCNDQNPDAWQVQAFYLDQDGDGYGYGLPLQLCAGFTPKYFSRNNEDCDDANFRINPRAKEICNGKDDDCSLDTPDGSYELGLNSRQEGVCKQSWQRCLDGRMQDDYRWIFDYEQQERSCDGLDNDCDGDIDESCGRIIFQYSQHSAQLSALKTVGWDGSNLATIISSTTDTFLDPVWSPDRNCVVYSKYTEHPSQTKLHLQELNHGLTIPVSNPVAADASWCSTGLILFVRNYEIWSVDPVIGASSELPLTAPKEITPFRPLNYHPDCSPDGRRMVYTHVIPEVSVIQENLQVSTSRSNLNFFIQIEDITGENYQLITESWPQQRSFYNRASWSPEGRFLVLSSDLAGPGNNELYLANYSDRANSADYLRTLVKLTEDGHRSFSNLPEAATYDDINPCLSDNGQYLAFLSKRTGNWQLYWMRLADRRITQLTFGEGEVLSLDCY